MENNKTSTVYKQMAKWQIMATVAVALVAGYFAGLHGALSALAGGGSAIAGGFAASIIARRGEHNKEAKNKEAAAILVSLLKAEAVKILTIIILLFITFKIYTAHLVPWALILGLAAAAIVSGMAVTALNENALNEKNET
ncbi:MAG TPA: ATP synthase subunit I [Methyloradius sp.]